MPLTVLVTGATGRTGSIVVKKLLQQPEKFSVRGFVRSPAKATELFGDDLPVFVGDIREPETLKPALEGCDALVILTSAIPQMQGMGESGRPQMGFPSDEMPEAIDYHGQVNQIDAAKAAGVDHIVLVGSMGGTDKNHMLNSIGNGNILIWKRKAEQYLIDSGIDYTIIHAGGLQDQPGGRRELLVGDNDQLLKHPPDGVPTSLPRADVAELVVQALQQPAARNKGFDVISKPEDVSAKVTSDFAALFEGTTPGL
ncbi:NAD(P)-dependent oxidoreductase [filamentous cyanobacterium CCP5]|nr:NAD(P)-dependent oxidoreductase [filamentous cyanobacterium CCP5]